jgi:cysteinyl-tRNA synthetase
MNILGLKVLEAETSEKSQIEDLINKRNRLRAEKKFDDSDAIRKRVRDLYSVELMDHKDRTVWKKVEKRSVPM